MKCFLRVGNDTLDEATGFDAIKYAQMRFERIAEDLARYGQTITGSIHIARTRDELVEDADWYLESDEDGNVKRSRG